MPPPDEGDVAADEVLDDAELGVTADEAVGFSGWPTPRQRIDFARQQRAEGLVFREELCNDSGGGGAVGGAKCIVDVDVAVLGEVPRRTRRRPSLLDGSGGFPTARLHRFKDW